MIEHMEKIGEIQQTQEYQQQSSLIPIARVNSTTGRNGTAGQNYTFAAT
jgi:hypothetical protein